MQHWVNSGNPSTEITSVMAILSQAAEDFGSAEGAETRRVSSNDTPAHERPAPSNNGDDIVRSPTKVGGLHKQESPSRCEGKADQTYVILALRAWLYFDGTNRRDLYLQTVSQLYFTLTLGDKPQFVAPCWYHPAGGGIYGSDATASVLNNGYPSQQAILDLGFADHEDGIN